MTNLSRHELTRIADAFKKRVAFPICTTVESFNPFEVANAIEAEARRVEHLEMPKVTLTMDIGDARKLARILRGER